MALAPGNLSSYNLAPGQSLADLDLKKKMAYALMQQGMSGEPVQHWTQALARAAQGAMGGYEMYQAEQDDKGDKEKARSIIQALSGGAETAPPTQPGMAPIAPAGSRTPAAALMAPPATANKPIVIGQGGMAKPDAEGVYGSDAVMMPNSTAYGPAIAGIETPGSKDPYAAIGPVTRTGARAYGKYQVMDFNIPTWTKEVLGKEMTPQQFLAAPDAQEQVFNQKFGQGAANPQDAASMWFTGKPAAQGASSRATTPAGVPYGPTGSSYVDSFNKNLGGGPMALTAPQGQPQPQPSAPTGPAPGTAPVGAAVDQPRGGMSDSRRQQLINALTQTRAGGAIGQALFAKEIDREATRARPLNEDEKKIYPGAVAIKASGEPIFPPPSTNVQLSTVANPVLEGVGKGIMDDQKAAKTAARQTIPIIHDARRLLDEGAITGQAADLQLMIRKVGTAFGMSDDKVANTEAFRSAIGNEVLAHIKALGANPSNADRDYIEKVQGGQIKLDEASLRKVLDMTEKYARTTIRNFNADAKKLQAASPEGTYKQIAPLLNFDEPPEYTAPAKPAAPAQAPPPSTAAPTRRAVGGKNYIKRGDQWFEE